MENIGINEIGTTAFIIAGIRVLEETREHPMFSDLHAQLFQNPELRETARWLTQVHFTVGDASRLRTPAFNVIVESGIRHGVPRSLPWFRFRTGFDSLQPLDTEVPFQIMETVRVIGTGTRFGGPGTDEKVGETARATKELAGCCRIALLERGYGVTGFRPAAMLTPGSSLIQSVEILANYVQFRLGHLFRFSRIPGFPGVGHEIGSRYLLLQCLDIEAKRHFLSLHAG